MLTEQQFRAIKHAMIDLNAVDSNELIDAVEVQEIREACGASLIELQRAFPLIAEIIEGDLP